MSWAWVKTWGVERPAWTLNLISCLELGLVVLLMVIVIPAAAMFERSFGVAPDVVVLAMAALVLVAVFIDGLAWSTTVGLALGRHGRPVSRVLASALWAPALAALAALALVGAKKLLLAVMPPADGVAGLVWLDFVMAWSALTATVCAGRLFGWACAALTCAVLARRGGLSSPPSTGPDGYGPAAAPAATLPREPHDAPEKRA